jgi:endonuclease III
MSKVKEIKLGKRGYKAIVKNKKFNFGDGKHIYEVIELSGPKMDKPRIFVDEESVRKYVGEIEIETKMDKLETSLIKNVLSKKDKKENLASKELMELVPDLETIVDASFRDMNAKRPEDTDK